MGELRERMQQALVVRGMSPRTQQSYLAAVQGLAKYYHQPPDTLSEAQLHAYLQYLIEQRHFAPSTPCTGPLPTTCPYLSGPRRCRWCSAGRRWRGC
jgi:hypothetical protein